MISLLVTSRTTPSVAAIAEEANPISARAIAAAAMRLILVLISIFLSVLFESPRWGLHRFHTEDGVGRSSILDLFGRCAPIGGDVAAVLPANLWLSKKSGRGFTTSPFFPAIQISLAVGAALAGSSRGGSRPSGRSGRS